MLPRVLHQLSQGKVASEQAKTVEMLMDCVGLQTEEGADESDWQSILVELQEAKDMSHAEVNAKRKQLTFRAFSDSTMPTKCDIIESMVNPNTQLMDKLFKRTAVISKLYHLPKHDKGGRSALMKRTGVLKHVLFNIKANLGPIPYHTIHTIVFYANSHWMIVCCFFESKLP